MHYFVTGGAGFIGSNLVDSLISFGNKVTVYDNLSTGRLKFLENVVSNPRLRFIKGDLLDLNLLKAAMGECTFVIHLSANADVRFGTEHPGLDLEQNTIATYNVLEAMRFNQINKIVFSSTGSVYGESSVIPTPEDGPFPIQTSLYGASKAACEGLISAYCEGYGFQSWIFRFVSILGERYTHGHIFDFYQKLKKDQNNLMVLGNGKQRKSYLYVQDCIDAILLAVDKSLDKINIFNLGFDGYVQVSESIGWICNEMGVSPNLEYSGGDRGWVGDNPFIYLNTDKIQAFGWRPKFNIEYGVRRTVQYLKSNEWVFDVRGEK